MSKALATTLAACLTMGLCLSLLIAPPGAQACEKHANAAVHAKAVANTAAKTDKAPSANAPQDLHIYLMIGQSNMAGRAKLPKDAEQVLERCYLLNDKGQWEPAKGALNRYSTVRKGITMQKLSPAYSFAKAMLKHDKNAKIGLVVNARGGSKIEQWMGKPYYWAARKRLKAALQTGTLKGVVWHQGESNSSKPKEYLPLLKKLIANLRTDFSDTNLPFVAGQIRYEPKEPINDEIAKLPTLVHATAVASSKGLKTQDRWHFDTDSQLKLGERYAEQMIKLHKAAAENKKPQAPKDMKFIDVHVHAMALKDGGLDAVAKWMNERNVERCIVSPLSHKGSRAWTAAEREVRRKQFAKYKGKIGRMCIIDPGEVKTVAQAVKILEREKKDGAIAFGEHYGKGLNFDDPKNLLLYEACEKVGLPVMFHIDQNKNMVEKGMKRVDKVCKQFRKCTIVAHAYWWRQLKDADRQLQQHPNLYADMSGRVVVNVLNRDRKFAREFIIRNQDKLLWATDEGWWSFGSQKKQMNQHYTFFEELDLPDKVRHKLYRGNAMKVYGLKPVKDEVG